MRHKVTWVLIADGARARIVALEQKGGTLDVVEKHEFSAEAPPSRELGRDRPARVHESVGQIRHAIEPKHDPHRELKRDFAAELAAFLEDRLRDREFDQLVVAAAPVTLGDLRQVFSDDLKSVVVAEAAKDLTKVPNSEVAEHLAQYIAV